MNFIKKNIKYIITFLLGGILTGGIVYATTYNAGDVSYTREGIENVKEALDDLYDKKQNYILPSGTINITTNGNNIDVKQYEKANVNITTASVSKTLLWTNTSPSTAMSNGNITLSSAITNFSHILIQWYVSTSNTTMIEDVFKVADYRDVLSSNNNAYYAIAHREVSGTNYNRLFWKVSATQLGYSDSGFNDPTGRSNYCIPYKIYGMNFSY